MTVTLISPQDMDHAKAALAELVAEATRRSSLGDIGEPIRVVLDGAAELLRDPVVRRSVEAISRVCRRVGIRITLRDAFAAPLYGLTRPSLGDLGGSGLIGGAVEAGLIQVDRVPLGEFTPPLMTGSIDDALQKKMLGGAR